MLLACRDPHAPKHGFVLLVDAQVRRLSIGVIIYMSNYCSHHGLQGFTPAHFDRKLSSLAIKCFLRVFPLRLRTLHHCFPDFKCVARLSMPQVAWLLGRYGRLRLNEHIGSPREFRFDFTHYCGIQVEGLPPALGGTYSLANFRDQLDGPGESDNRKT